MSGYGRAKYLMTSGPKRSRLGQDLNQQESVQHMFNRHGIPFTATCNRRGAAYHKALSKFVATKFDEDLKILMTDTYDGVPTDIAFKAENEYKGRHM